MDRVRQELAGEPQAESPEEREEMAVDGKASLRATKNRLKDLSVLATQTLRRYRARESGLKSVQSAGRALATDCTESLQEHERRIGSAGLCMQVSVI